MTDANCRDRQWHEMLGLQAELINDYICEDLERRQRAGLTTVTRAVIDQSIKRYFEDRLKDRQQLEEKGTYGVIDYLERERRNPGFRERYYKRYGV